MPKKKNNITRTGANTYAIKFEKQILGAPEFRLNQMYNIVNWGRKNDYCYRLEDLYMNSITHRSCVDFAVNAICGNGVDLDAMKMNSEDLQNPNYYQDWNTFIKAIAFDFVLFGNFAFQVIKNKDNRTYSFFHQPMETVRLEPFDEDGVIEYCQVSNDWTALAKNPATRIPVFGFQEEEEIPAGQVYMFIYRSPNPASPYYGAPTYCSGIKAIQSEIAYLDYDLRSISNGFVSSGVLTFPPTASDEQKQAIADNVQRMFTGSENANALMIVFKEQSEDDVVGYTPFTASNDQVDLFSNANERTVNRIIAAHKISSKGLIGLPMDSTGFSNEGSLLQAALQVYNTNICNSNRTTLLSAINSAFRLNGVDIEIVLKPLSYASVTDAGTSIGEPQDGDEVTEKGGNATA